MKRTTRTSSRLIGGLAALVLVGAACSNQAPGGEQAADAAVAPVTTTDQPTTPAAAIPAALLGRSELGDVMVGPDGLTLYGFTNDVEAASTCYDACADAWPPVLVDRNWGVGPGLDIGIFATTVRDDGSLQLVAGKWPLYSYVGDEALGDVNGQGSGDVWFAVAPDGALITDDQAPEGGSDDEAGSDDDAGSVDGAGVAADSPVATAETELGSTLVDGDGLTLYGFTNDVDGQPSCDGACADAWPPLLVDALATDIDPTMFSLVTRSDGSTQLAIGPWPLYRFAGDAAPGDINGQGSGGVWFAVADDGSLLGRDGAATASGEADAATGEADGDADTSTDTYTDDSADEGY